MTLLALLAAAAATPQPSELRLFRDWIVGCDNGRQCQAVALVSDSWPDDAATMSVRRGPEAAARPRISFDIDGKGGVALAADGRRLPVRLVPGEAGPEVASADAAAVIAILRSARELRVLDKGGTSLGTISVAGASAALLYMDDQQKRAGGVTALVHPGPRRELPPPPPLPQIRAAPAPAGGFTVTPQRIAALRAEAGCRIEEVGGPDTFDTAPLDDQHMLVLLACGSGAYNVTYIPYLATRQGSAVRFRVAPFDVKPSWWEDGRPTLINGGWDPRDRRLGSFSKGRGLGDCGTMSEYAWDGSRFRLVHQAEMDECRGSMDYITTWRAEVAQR